MTAAVGRTEVLLDQLAPDAPESADLHDRVRAMEGRT